MDFPYDRDIGGDALFACRHRHSERRDDNLPDLNIGRGTSLPLSLMERMGPSVTPAALA